MILKSDQAPLAHMADIQLDGTCPCCKNPLTDEHSLEMCMLNSDCCATCIAQCMAANRCGLITDQEFWDKLDTLFSGFGKQRIIPGKQRLD